MDPITRKLVETVRQITEAAPNAPHRNPLVHAAAQFLHKELGPLTWQKDESGKSTTDHPWHYSNRLSMGLQDPMTTDVNTIVDAAHQHIIGGHHNMGDWSYQNLPPEDTINYDDVDTIHEMGEDEMSERLADYLHGVKDELSKNVQKENFDLMSGLNTIAHIQKKGKYSDGTTGLPDAGQKVDEYGNIVRDRRPGVIMDGRPSTSTGYDPRGTATPPYNPNKPISKTGKTKKDNSSLTPNFLKFPVQGNDGY